MANQRKSPSTSPRCAIPARAVAHVPAAILFQTTVNAVATTNLCVIAALTAVGVGAFEESPVVEQCASGMLHYMQRRKARMEELAWPP